MNHIKNKTQNKKEGQLSGILMILLIWILLAAYQRIALDKPFPYPWEAILALLDPSQNMLLHAGASLLRWGSGFILASSLGIVLGIIMGLSPVVERLFSPLVTVLQLIPGLAWIPITMIVFGLGNGATIFMITVTAIAPIIINTRSGIQQIETVLLQAAQTMELSPRRTFFRVILPGAAPSIISGLRTGAANGFRVLISAEMVVGSSLGLGYALYQSRWTLDYQAAFGALTLIIIIGLIVERVIFSSLDCHIRQKRGLL